MGFAKGQSGNPGGRPKESDEVKRLAREFTEEAMNRLAWWMRSDNPKASVSASATLLDRGWGKAAQAIAGADGESPLKLEITWQTEPSGS